jgi:hypothetical protein
MIACASLCNIAPHKNECAATAKTEQPVNTLEPVITKHVAPCQRE